MNECYVLRERVAGVNYHEWEAQVPSVFKDDVLWKHEAYQLAMFLGDLAWHDATRLMTDRRTIASSDQLYRATGGISSNIAEGYSRSSPKDRARFYEYALGSACESRDWYYKSRHIPGETVSSHRLELTTQIIRLTLSMISHEHKAVARLSRAKAAKQRPSSHATRNT